MAAERKGKGKGAKHRGAPARAGKFGERRRRTPARNGASATGEIFPNGGLNGPARALRDQGHAGMVTVAMNRLGKEMDGYLFASLTAAKDEPTGHSDQELAILPASAIAEKRTGKGRHAVLCWHRHAGNSCSLSCRYDLANYLESWASGTAFSPSGQRALSRWWRRKARSFGIRRSLHTLYYRTSQPCQNHDRQGRSG